MPSRIISIYVDSFAGLNRSVWLLSFIMFINRAGAMVLPFMSLYLTKSLNFSLTEAGYVMAAYGVGSILGAYLGGQLTDRFGFYHVQLYSLIGGSILLFALIFLDGFWSIMTVIFLFSTVADSLRPANSVAIASYSEIENRTRSFSLMRFAINLGFSIGPAIGGITAGMLGYKWIFVLDAITCLIAAIVLYRLLPYDPSLRVVEKKETIKTGTSAYKDSKYLIFIFLTTIWAILFFQLFTSAPVYWKNNFAMSEEMIGLLLALNGLIIVIVEMPVVKSIEHITNYMRMISLGSICLVLSFLALVAGLPFILAAILFIVFMSLAEMFAMPFMTNYAVSRPSEDRRGQFMALYAMAYGVAHIIAPVSGLFLAEKYGFMTTYSIFLVLSLLVAISFYLLQSFLSPAHRKFI
jgi:predicted MFS family arabinose efflux permease